MNFHTFVMWRNFFASWALAAGVAVNAALAQPPQPTHFDPDASPYGDGRASARIVAALRGTPLPEFSPGLRSGGAIHPHPHEVMP